MAIGDESAIQQNLLEAFEDKPLPTDIEEIKKEKEKIIKNHLLICLVFLCNFISFGGVSSLQSSLNYKENLGTVSLSAIYAALIFSAMFTPAYVISKLGCKWTICISIVGYATYPLANFYPTWTTLILSSIILGFSAAPLWSAKSTYVTTTAKRYAQLTNETADTAVNAFFGVFFLFFQFNNIIGQLISSFVLSSRSASNLVLPDCYHNKYIENYCGANDCQEDFEEARKRYNSSSCPINQIQSEGVDDTLLYILMGIYTAIGLLGSLITALFLDNVDFRKKQPKSRFDLLFATFKQLKDSRQILLIFITAYSGFEQAFFTGDFTRSFVSCPLSVNWIGFVLICFGIVDSIGSYGFGRMEKYTGRIPLFLFAFVVNLGCLVAFLSWTPYPTNAAIFFTLSALWGLSDAIWQTQLNACYGIFFIQNQEAAFSNYRLWESLGFVIAFAFQGFLCVSTKILILLGVLIVGMLLYGLAEVLDRRMTKNENISQVFDRRLTKNKNELRKQMEAVAEESIREEKEAEESVSNQRNDPGSWL